VVHRKLRAPSNLKEWKWLKMRKFQKKLRQMDKKENEKGIEALLIHKFIETFKTEL
jgi:hypothetical protein